MQTPDQRAALLKAGKDGAIFCLDLDEVEGQAAANVIGEMCRDVRRALGLRKVEDELRYLVALMPAKVPGRAVVRLAHVEALAEAIEQTWTRSKDFGDTFAVVIVPQSPDIAHLFRATTFETVGTA